MSRRDLEVLHALTSGEGLGAVKEKPADYADVPLCPEPHKGRRCNGPLVTRAEHRYPSAYPESVRLVCLACGEGREGTDKEVARAERARDAWIARGRKA